MARTAVVAMGASAALAPIAHADEAWTQLLGDPSRSGVRERDLFPDLSQVRWTLTHTPSGQAIAFTPAAGVVGALAPVPLVVGAASIQGQSRAVGVDARTGAVVWTTPIPARALGSWSTPAIDAARGVALIASGSALTALRVSDGVQLWQVALAAPVVNASPLVVSTPSYAARAFVTDFGSFGGPSSLTCINLSPRHDGLNPFDPGAVVWSVPVGSASGASPAFARGLVLVASTGLDATGAGEVRAFDAHATTIPAPRWIATNSTPEGFFGGLSVREDGADAWAYAASYAFFGGLDSSNLVKLDVRTGAIVWSVPCNRTSSAPVVLADGRIALATGVLGFGSAPALELFQDQGSSATRVWNSALATWSDANANQALDPGEFQAFASWTTHPIALRSPLSGQTRVLVGAGAGGAANDGAFASLALLDLAQHPAQPAFVTQFAPGVGATPALLGGCVLSVGSSGLRALGAAPPAPDVTRDGHVGADDASSWERGVGARDVDGSGAVTPADRDELLRHIRAGERAQLLGGPR